MTALIEALMKGEQELQAEDSLEDVLEENNMPTPQLRQIYVLGVAPEHAHPVNSPHISYPLFRQLLMD